MLSDEAVQPLLESGRPVLLHCGASWSTRSREVAAELAQWARGNASQSGDGVICVGVDVATAPKLFEQRKILTLPTLLLLRAGKVEDRVDGAGVADLEPLFEMANAYTSTSLAAKDLSMLSPRAALDAGLELLRQDAGHATVAPFLRRVLKDEHAGASNVLHEVTQLCFRARLNLLRSALRAAKADQFENFAATPEEAAVKEIATLVEELHTLHKEQLAAGPVCALTDLQDVTELLAHAELLLDALAAAERAGKAGAGAPSQEDLILQHYAHGRMKEALQGAVDWYKVAAGQNLHQLVADSCRPWRRAPDRPSVSYGAFMQPMPPSEPLDPEAYFHTDHYRARALLQRLLVALGPDSQSGVAAEARAKLQLLLDRKKHTPYHTRIVRVQRPHCAEMVGLGTGKRSGYSKKYWIAFGGGRVLPNTRPIGSPHCDFVT